DVMADDPNKKKPRTVPPQLKKVASPPPPPPPPPLPKPKVTADELGIGDDWLSAIDEWDAKLDLPTNTAPPPPPPKAPPLPPEDPLMGFVAGEGASTLPSEGEALGPGLGLDPAPPPDFTPAPTVAVSQNQLLDKLLKSELRPTPATEENHREFEEQPDTRSLSYEQLQKLAQSTGGDFSDM